MKKFLGILLALVGLLLTAVGIAGIVLIGSDDTVDSPTTTIKLGDARAVVSTPSLMAFTNTTLRLTATSPAGSVFIGQAHPIDAKSYLAGTPTYAVTKVDTSGMHGELVKGDAKVALPDPTKQTFWTSKATGKGTQTLTMKLDGEPSQYVVMPLGKGGNLTMTSGVQISNGFALSIGALVLGLLGLVGGLLFMRRRKAPTESATVDAAPAETEVAAEETAAPARALSRIVTFAVIGAVVPTMAGCGVVPTQVDAWKTSELTKPAMANQAEAVAAMKDYDVRNNAAIKSTASSFSPVDWAKADTGMVYAQDSFGTDVRKMLNDKSSVPSTHTVRSFYSPAFSTYPMYSVLNLDRSTEGRVSHAIAVMTKEGVSAPWLMSASAPYTMADLPHPIAPEDARPITQPEKATLLKRVAELTKQLNAGKGSLVTDGLSTIVEDYRSEGGKPASFRLWSSETDQFGPRGSVRAVKVNSGTSLVAVSFQADTTHDAGEGRVWDTAELNSNYLKATGQIGSRRLLHVRTGVTAILLVDTKGGIKSLAVDADGLRL